MDRKTAEQLYDAGKEVTVEWLLRLDMKIDELTEKVEKLSKNSSNSSKPPSSDIVKPNRSAKRHSKKKRKKGGQPGHAKYERIPFNADEVTSVDYTLSACPQCHGRLKNPISNRPKSFNRSQFQNNPSSNLNIAPMPTGVNGVKKFTIFLFHKE
ncbi:MAG: hypothetical protein GF398_02995 [Chitinivibrionales bacterium]|nr:hypothetical protein [Chitinivibrionales bacterium]